MNKLPEPYLNRIITVDESGNNFKYCVQNGRILFRFLTREKAQQYIESVFYSDYEEKDAAYIHAVTLIHTAIKIIDRNAEEEDAYREEIESISFRIRLAIDSLRKILKGRKEENSE